MAEAVEHALPADVAILVAAVADWKVVAAPQQAQEERRPAATRIRPQSRHSRHARPAPRPPAPADRVRRGNRACRRQRHRQARCQERRLDRRQRCLGRRHGRRATTGSIWSPTTGVEDWPRRHQGRGRAPLDRQHISRNCIDQSESRLRACPTARACPCPPTPPPARPGWTSSPPRISTLRRDSATRSPPAFASQFRKAMKSRSGRARGLPSSMAFRCPTRPARSTATIAAN